MVSSAIAHLGGWHDHPYVEGVGTAGQYVGSVGKHNDGARWLWQISRQPRTIRYFGLTETASYQSKGGLESPSVDDSPPHKGTHQTLEG